MLSPPRPSSPELREDKGDRTTQTYIPRHPPYTLMPGLEEYLQDLVSLRLEQLLGVTIHLQAIGVLFLAHPLLAHKEDTATQPEQELPRAISLRSLHQLKICHLTEFDVEEAEKCTLVIADIPPYLMVLLGGPSGGIRRPSLRRRTCYFRLVSSHGRHKCGLSIESSIAEQ